VGLLESDCTVGPTALRYVFFESLTEAVSVGPVCHVVHTTSKSPPCMGVKETTAQVICGGVPLVLPEQLQFLADCW